MKASVAGKVEYVKMLLDSGAEVNMQDNVGCVCNAASPVVNDDVCARILFSSCVSCYLISKFSTCKKRSFLGLLPRP